MTERLFWLDPVVASSTMRRECCKHRLGARMLIYILVIRSTGNMGACSGHWHALRTWNSTPETEGPGNGYECPLYFRV